MSSSNSIGSAPIKLAAFDGSRFSITTPHFLMHDDGTGGVARWRAIESYYAAITALCGAGLCGVQPLCTFDANACVAKPSDGGDVGASRETHVDGDSVSDREPGSGSNFALPCAQGTCGATAIDIGSSNISGSVADLGKRAKKNRRKYEKKKQMSRSWRERVDGSGGCVSDSGSASVRTVDTRTAVELEAVQTLAARRVVENKLAIAQGKARLRSYGDRAKTDAYARLAEARMEQRINEAKAKSQASFKKCDESLKSLGSTGSAGEFAMRREIQKAKSSEKELLYIKAQADILIKYASPEVLALCNNVPPPEKVDAFEIFGDCPSEYSEEEAEAYYLELQKMNEEEDLRFTTQFA